jgi:hypothetical protein
MRYLIEIISRSTRRDLDNLDICLRYKILGFRYSCLYISNPSIQEPDQFLKTEFFSPKTILMLLNMLALPFGKLNLIILVRFQHVLFSQRASCCVS